MDYSGHEVLELYQDLVAIEEMHVAQVQPELRLDSNLQQMVLKQDPIVLAHELIQKFINSGMGGSKSSEVQAPKKASSGVGPRLGSVARPPDKTSTRRLPTMEGAWGTAVAGAAHSPKRSWEGKGIDKVLEVGSTPLLMLLLVGSLQPSPAPSCISAWPG